MALVADFRTATSAIMDRLRWFRQAGITFDGRRDTYQILGYPRILSNRDYRDRYTRGGVAGRIVDALPNATWRGEVELIEDEKPTTNTPFEQAWEDLDTRLQIQAKLSRVDKLSRLSTYAVLLIGAPGDLDTELPRGGPDNLLYLTPFIGGGGPVGIGDTRRLVLADDADCTIHTFEIDTKSPRFGQPLTYQLKRISLTTTDMGRMVHWTRIIHIAENLLEDEVYGQPALERVWNLLDDLDKVTGGGAEAFWLRANAGLHLNVDKDLAVAKAKDGQPDELDKLKQQADDYANQMVRMLRTRGVEINQLGSDVANFLSPADAILTQIAGATSIPKRILTGSEMGELASSQDRDNWKDQVNGRQTGYAGPYIVRPLVARLIEYGYLPSPAKGPLAYEVKWPHIQTLTEQEKVEGAKGWATVNQTQGTVVFTDDEIRDKWAGREPLTPAQKKQAIADKAALAVLRPAPPNAQGAPQAGKPVAPAAPFGRRAAEELNQTLRALEEAIESDDIEAIGTLLSLQRKFSSTQVQIPREQAALLFQIGDLVVDDDLNLAEGGRENDAHVTVKYGLHTDDFKDVAAVVKGRGALTFTFGKTNYFSTPNYDVLYVEVQSEQLNRLNKLIATSLEVTDTHPTYQPHATVAYLKPGRGESYRGLGLLNGVNAYVDTLVFSNTQDVKTEIRLG